MEKQGVAGGIKIIFILGFLTAALLFGVKISSAQDISGVYCATLHLTEDESGPKDETLNFKIQVTPVKGSYCVVHSVLKVVDDGPVILGGTCQTVGTLIYMNLTLTQKHKSPWRDSGVLQVAINKSTLSGTFFSVQNSFNRSTHQFDPDYSAGKIVLKKCP